jgi:hypothetical protein
MYARSVYKYLHDFRKAVQNAASKSKYEYELIGVLNSAKRRFAFASSPTSIAPKQRRTRITQLNTGFQEEGLNG